MNIISIGDIHGRNNWKLHLFGSLQGYEDWRNELIEGISDFMSDIYPYSQFDRIIFVGDYVDSFDVSNIEMKQNLEEIVHLKTVMPDRVVLLLGNHDIQYILPGKICSGFRQEMAYDFGDIFKKNLNLFQIAYYHENAETGKRTLWTHAGVSQNWLRFTKELISNKKFRFKSHFENSGSQRVDEFLNQLWDYRVEALFAVDSDSGGSSPIGGPLWIRPNRLRWDAIEGFDQVVGHTPQRNLRVIVAEKISETTKDEVVDSIYLIDCLEHGSGETLIKQY